MDIAVLLYIGYSGMLLFSKCQSQVKSYERTRNLAFHQSVLAQISLIDQFQNIDVILDH